MPFFFSIEKKKPSWAFAMGFCSGAIFYTAILFWLIHVSVFGMMFLSVYLGIYIALFALGFSYSRKYKYCSLLFVPCLWIVLEYARSHLFTGFPWALLAYTQTPFVCALQGADIFGSWGVSFTVMFVNVFIFTLIEDFRSSRSVNFRKNVLPLCVIFLWFAYGCWKLSIGRPEDECGLRTAVIQSDIRQDIKWVESFKEGIFRKQALLSEMSVLEGSPDLIVWPETSYTDYIQLGLNDAELSGLASRLKTALLIGAIRAEEGKYLNSAILYASTGSASGTYDKLHLVPFGEYIPGRKFMPFLESLLPIEDFTPGKDFSLFRLSAQACRKDFRFGVLICFEDIFPELARGFVLRGADFLVNMTNDGWFGDSSSPSQHMQASVLRAVENRVFVLRSANTGISCIIDDSGRLLKVVSDRNGKPTFVKGQVCATVLAPRQRSFYTRFGDFLIPFACAVIFGMILARRRRP